MKLKNLIKSVSIIFMLLAMMFACTEPTASEMTKEITQINYIIPVWKGSLTKAPSNPEAGWAYYNKAVKKSFIYDGSSWQIIAQDGSDGINGKDGTGIIWKGELASTPSNPQLNWAYYNTIGR